MQSLFVVRRIAVTLAAALTMGAAAAIAASDPPPPPPVPSDAYVTLSTQFRGLGVPLDFAFGDATGTIPYLAQIPPGGGSGRAWLIVQDKNPYLYTIRSPGSGSGPEMCLQASTREAEKQPKMMPCARFAEQQWRFRKDGDFYRITASVTGLDVCLDIINGGPTDGQVTLEPCAGYSGQLWVFTPTAPPLATPPVATSPAVTALSLADQCKAMVQDRVAWDPVDASRTRWNEGNLDQLCNGTANPAGTVACFTERLQITRRWQDAVALCDADPATIAATTPPVAVPVPDVPVEPPVVGTPDPGARPSDPNEPQPQQN